jgi:hypothetical protein
MPRPPNYKQQKQRREQEQRKNAEAKRLKSAARKVVPQVAVSDTDGTKPETP